MVLIYLDAGHGGKDPGAVGINGLKEKDVVLDICKRMNTLLQDYKDVHTLLTRDSDIFLSLDARTKKANTANADIFISIHCNSAANSSANGFETYIYPGSGLATSAFQNVMHGEILRAIGTNVNVFNRGKKQANLHVLRESKMKAILTENLFINNAADNRLLADESFRQKLAQGHVTGLEKFLGLKKAAQPPPTENKLWIVQVGAFDKKENAEAMMNDLRKEGYKPFIKYE